MCEDLAQALHQLQEATDQQIYDLVLAHIAPLPVLRQTLVEWSQGGLSAGLSAACADVLLVLRPEHLCNRIAGKSAARPTGCTKYCPAIHPPRCLDPPSGLPVCWCGGLSCGWLQRWRLDSLPPVELDARELEPPACSWLLHSLPSSSCSAHVFHRTGRLSCPGVARSPCVVFLGSACLGASHCVGVVRDPGLCLPSGQGRCRRPARCMVADAEGRRGS